MIVQPSDAVLVTRALDGDAASFESLVLRHQRKAHAVARAHGVPAAAGDDVVQDAFLAAYRGLGSLRDREKFAPWLLSIARAASRRYASWRVEPPGYVGSYELDAGTPAPSPADPLEAAELREHVRRRVLALPEGLREAIFLYYYEGRSTREAARALDTSTAAVKKRLQKGRDILREELWRELASSLRDLLPSTRDWRAKGRGLALVALAAMPAAGGHAAGGTERLASGGAGTAAVSTWLVCGGFLMSAKKLTCAVAAACLLLGLGGWLTVARLRPERGEQVAALPRPATAVATMPDPTPPAGAAGGDPTPAPRPALRVRVVDEAGEVVADARVTTAWARKDQNGMRILNAVAHSLEAVAPGELVARTVEGDVVSLTAAAASCLPSWKQLEVPPDGLPDPILMELERCQESIRLRFFDPRNRDRPLPGVRVGPLAGDLWPSDGVPGRPLPPLNFEAFHELVRLFEATSDEQGELTLCLRPDADRLWATCDGYGPVALVTYSSQRPEPGALLSIPMHPPTTLRIAVRSADGAAVPGFQYAIGEDALSLPGASDRVDGDETVHELYHLIHLDPQPRSARSLVVLVKAGELEASARLEPSYGEESPVELLLQPATTAIHGRVIDAQGLPVANALVGTSPPSGGIYVIDDELRPRPEHAVTTGEDGLYEIVFAGCPPSFSLLVRRAGQPFHMSEIVRLKASERRRHNVSLPAPATITARLAPAIAARSGVEVELTNERALISPRVEYKKMRSTDARGLVRFEDVHAGVWTLLWSQGRGFRRLPVAVAAGQSCEVVLGDPEAGALDVLPGILVSGGAPVARQDLRLSSADDRLIDLTTSDALGAFAFREVPPGTHSLSLYPSAGRPGAPIHYLRLEVEEGMTPVRLDITPRTVSGRVVGPAGPLAAVEVKPYSVQHFAGGPRLAAFHTAQTDADGAFRLPWLLEETTLLVLERQGYATRRVEWRRRDSLEDDIGEVRLEPGSGGRVRFAVVDEAGVEMPRVLIDVFATDLAAPFQVARIHRTGLNEELAVAALPTGRYRAFVRPGDLMAQEHTSEAVEFEHVAGADQDVRVETRPGGSVCLELRSSDGRLPAAAIVEVFDPEGRPTLGWRGEQRLSFSGREGLVGLPRGPLTARVSARGWKTVEVPFEVVPGRVATITAAMERE